MSTVSASWERHLLNVDCVRELGPTFTKINVDCVCELGATFKLCPQAGRDIYQMLTVFASWD